MKRAYLEEDIDLIRKYFPGARTVALRTPFDLTRRPQHRTVPAGGFRDTGGLDNDAPASWQGSVLWMS